MSNATTFDTLAFVKELETAGVPPAHAEAQVKAFASALRQVEESKKDELATKRDLAETEGRIVRWTAGMFAAQTALVLGVLFATGKIGQPPAQPTVYQPPAQEMRQQAPSPAPAPAPQTALPAPPTAPAH